MPDWNVTGTKQSGVDIAVEAMTLGFATAPTTYEVTHQESGEVKHVTAYTKDGLGNKIAKGDFDDD
jgi:hypothetical protein